MAIRKRGTPGVDRGKQHCPGISLTAAPERNVSVLFFLTAALLSVLTLDSFAYI